MDNALIIDLVLAAVLAVFALLGARKGLIRSLMALVERGGRAHRRDTAHRNVRRASH